MWGKKTVLFGVGVSPDGWLGSLIWTSGGWTTFWHEFNCVLRKSYILDISFMGRSIVFSIWSKHFVKRCLVARFFKLLEKSLDPLKSDFDHDLLRSNYSMNSNVFITLLQEALRGSKAYAFVPFWLTLNYTPITKFTDI